VNTEQVRLDFDEIARLAANGESGRDRYDAALLALIPPNAASVLEVGSGLGRLTAAIARPGRRVLGIDLSPEMIERARSNAPAGDVSFLCADLLTWHTDDRFDCIASVATLHHLPLDEALSRMEALLQRGGRLIIHDLCDTRGLLGYMKLSVAIMHDAARRLMRTGSPVVRRQLRDAWRRHAAHDVYLTIDQVHDVARTRLPGARVIEHWLGRYTLVWDRD
jgi:SAM-dependent methyltransferase